jgi:hypothetical protein
VTRSTAHSIRGTTKPRFNHEPGKCHECADKGIVPSEAIACYLHSTHTIDQLKAEIAVLKNASGASSRLHLAIADLYGAVPSADGSEELAYVKELHARADRVRDAIQAALTIANYDDEQAVASGPRGSIA